MENENDIKLVSDYLDGKEDALKEIVQKYYKTIYRFLFNFLGGSAESADLTQEVFLKVWKNIKKYNKKYSFKTWIFTIARNTALDFLRKKRDLVFSDFENEEGENALEDTIQGDLPSADEIFSQIENEKALKKELDKLPLIYREVLLLRYEEDMSFEEIGVILNRPEETAKSQHRRALILVRKNIDIFKFS
ncbi:MAG: sigma-70 family RNA polymerase sigma factor [Minisyncoccia bacterium]